MRNVNISLSPPLADEEDGRKAPGPETATSAVISTRLAPELASSLNAKASELGITQSSAVKEAISSFVRKRDDAPTRGERGAVLGELIQLRSQLQRMQRIYEAQIANGREPNATIVQAWLHAYRSLAQAAERISM